MTIMPIKDPNFARLVRAFQSQGGEGGHFNMMPAYGRKRQRIRKSAARDATRVPDMRPRQMRMERSYGRKRQGRGRAYHDQMKRLRGALRGGF